MGAHRIISSKPNTQNDKKPISSIFSRKSEKLPAPVVLLYGSDGTKNSGWPVLCQQLILFFWERGATPAPPMFPVSHSPSSPPRPGRDFPEKFHALNPHRCGWIRAAGRRPNPQARHMECCPLLHRGRGRPCYHFAGDAGTVNSDMMRSRECHRVGSGSHPAHGSGPTTPGIAARSLRRVTMACGRLLRTAIMNTDFKRTSRTVQILRYYAPTPS